MEMSIWFVFFGAIVLSNLVGYSRSEMKVALFCLAVALLDTVLGLSWYMHVGIALAALSWSKLTVWVLHFLKSKQVSI